MHSSAQAWHIAMHASSIIVMVGIFMPVGRIIIRIMVLHMSAQFMHVAMHLAVPVMPSAAHMSAHVVQACSHAAHASIHSCIVAMSMSGIGVSTIFIIWTDVFIIAPFPASQGEEVPPMGARTALG